MFSGWVNKLKAWVSGEAVEYDWDEAHAKYLSFLTPGPFQQAVAAGNVELVREMLARGEDPNQLDETPGGYFALQCAMVMLDKRRHPDFEDADAVRNVFACNIPEEIFPRVVAFWAHAGFYVSAAAVAEIEANTALAGNIRRQRQFKSSRAAALEDVIARLERV